MDLQDLEALEGFLRDLRHTARQAMGRVQGHIKALEEEHVAIEPLPDWMEERLSYASNLQRIIDPRFLASEIQMLLLIEAVLAGFRRMAQKKGVSISIHCQGLEAIQAVRAYRCLFDDGFNYVIRRAIRSTGPGGSVTVSAQLSEEQSAVLLMVHDTGHGINPRFCEILNSGQDLDEKETVASGADQALDLFGMQRARNFLVAHGGRFTIEGSDSTGTKCSMVLPITSDASGQTHV
jgi:signal transduction histidine kinase